CVACERAALRAMRAGCSAPIGVYARSIDGKIVVEAAHAPENAPLHRERIERAVSTLEEAEAAGVALAARFGELQPIASRGALR
ncbi:MAG: hypothetical protein WA814_11125, partial [Candidatus Baltobacteraceae bacterium]